MTRAVLLLNNAFQCKGNMVSWHMLGNAELGWGGSGLGSCMFRMYSQNLNLSIPIILFYIFLLGGTYWQVCGSGCHNTPDGQCFLTLSNQDVMLPFGHVPPMGYYKEC